MDDVDVYLMEKHQHEIRKGKESKKGMNIETILEKIGEGYVLKVPKGNLRIVGRLPLLIDGIRQDFEFKKKPLLVGWEEVDKLLGMKISLPIGNRICKIEKADYENNEGKVYKKGWKSMGWDGENFDFYRMVM